MRPAFELGQLSVGAYFSAFFHVNLDSLAMNLMINSEPYLFVKRDQLAKHRLRSTLIEIPRLHIEYLTTEQFVLGELSRDCCLCHMPVVSNREEYCKKTIFGKKELAEIRRKQIHLGSLHPKPSYNIRNESTLHS